MVDGTVALTGAVDLSTWLEHAPRALAAHTGHKGRQGDVWVAAAYSGMRGTCRLAARAALFAGVDRVFQFAEQVDDSTPEVMQGMDIPNDSTVAACCCGGGAIASMPA